ncbi:unnamed protein product [Sphagnum balticum]
MMDSGNPTPGEGIHAALGLDSALYEESFNKLYSEAAVWKAEKARLKELLMTTTSDLKEKALSLSALQAALADALIAKAIHLLSDEI